MRSRWLPSSGRGALDPELEDGQGSALQSRLIEAHASRDLVLLVSLYREASEMAEQAHDRARAAFYMTHAWVFALEAGSQDAEFCADRLRAWGRL